MNNFKNIIFNLLVWLLMMLILSFLVNTLTLQLETSIVIPMPMFNVPWHALPDKPNKPT